MIFRIRCCSLEARRQVRTGHRFPWRLDSDPGEARGARGRGARGADFARGRGARGAGLRPRANPAARRRLHVGRIRVQEYKDSS
jgi:hypothetical protein